MKKVLYTGTIALVLAFVLMYVPIGHAQNLTSNATNMMGNASAGLNQTASELGKNDTLGNVLNKTGDGAADVVNNISEEVKEGVGANK